MREISLHILDILTNSISANAKNIKLEVIVKDNLLTIRVIDDGKGMSEDFLARVVDPFQTTRTTRKIGMGIPLLKQAAETAGGNFKIESKLGQGTTVEASFEIDHIDRSPLGNLAHALVPVISEDFELEMHYEVNDKVFNFDTKQIKEILEGVPIDSQEILTYLSGYLEENIQNTNGGYIIWSQSKKSKR